MIKIKLNTCSIAMATSDNLNTIRRNYITEVEGEYVINSKSNDRAPYEIEKVTLDSRVNFVYSAWILRLMHEEWIDLADLYELAVLIDDAYPEFGDKDYSEKIDWFETFYVVQKKFYFQNMADVQTDSDESEYKYILNKIKFTLDGYTPESHERIEAIVRKKLRRYGLNSEVSNAGYSDMTIRL